MTVQNKFVRICAALLAAALAAVIVVPCAVSASEAEPFGGLPSRRNAATGYCAVVADEADLLTDAQEAALLDEMYPLTTYANIAVYTVDTETDLTDFERARIKRVELFGTDVNAAIFTVDLYLRRIVIQRRGIMEKYLTNSRSNNITNNVASYAKDGDYNKVCVTGVQQMLAVIQGDNVPKPMKYLSNGVIALILGCLTATFTAVYTSTTRKKREKTTAAETAAYVSVPLLIEIESCEQRRQKVVPRSRDSDYGSSCGSSCGSSGGSSCGSSCGGSSF